MEWQDLNFWRSVVTVVSLVLFLGLMGWTWARRRTAAFDEAAQLPFAGDDQPASPGSSQQ